MSAQKKVREYYGWGEWYDVDTRQWHRIGGWTVTGSTLKAATQKIVRASTTTIGLYDQSPDELTLPKFPDGFRIAVLTKETQSRLERESPTPTAPEGPG